MQHTYTWDYRIEIPPYEKIMDVLDAFFSSYPAGDYSREHREHYKLSFRRGAWRKGMMGLGQLVPERLVAGQFTRWPVIVRVLVRPAPETFLITIKYELHLPKSVRPLSDEVQSSVDQHVRKELKDLAAYLAECTGADEPPAVNPE
jgi:hypothetical protein